jgi:hypothetical protein
MAHVIRKEYVSMLNIRNVDWREPSPVTVMNTANNINNMVNQDENELPGVDEL